jgi:hypothetical protein
VSLTSGVYQRAGGDASIRCRRDMASGAQSSHFVLHFNLRAEDSHTEFGFRAGGFGDDAANEGRDSGRAAEKSAVIAITPFLLPSQNPSPVMGSPCRAINHGLGGRFKRRRW